MTVALLLRTLPVLLVAAPALTPATARARSAPSASSAAARCSSTNLVPTTANVDAVRAAIVCLHNQIRAARHLPLLRENARLRRAALAHSADMVSNRYFDHTAPSGTTFTERMLGAGNYVGRSRNWILGENIAWGTGSEATANNVMRAWMLSPGHRANIVRRSYREVGIGIMTGVPTDDTSGGTFTADFGARD
jgi:uncharacterized protein YkwD